MDLFQIMKPPHLMTPDFYNLLEFINNGNLQRVQQMIEANFRQVINSGWRIVRLGQIRIPEKKIGLLGTFLQEKENWATCGKYVYIHDIYEILGNNYKAFEYIEVLLRLKVLLYGYHSDPKHDPKQFYRKDWYALGVKLADEWSAIEIESFILNKKQNKYIDFSKYFSYGRE